MKSRNGRMLRQEHLANKDKKEHYMQHYKRLKQLHAELTAMLQDVFDLSDWERTCLCTHAGIKQMAKKLSKQVAIEKLKGGIG